MLSRNLEIIAIASLLAFPFTLQGQRVEPPRARTDSTISPRINNGHHRFFGALGGSVLGAIGGGLLGYQILPHDCGCDDPGLDALIYGALAGSAIGASFGAAAPDLRSVCSFDRRFKRSLIGYSIAAGVSYVLAGGAGSEGTIIAVPLGAIGGSLAALGECWKSRL